MAPAADADDPRHRWAELARDPGRSRRSVSLERRWFGQGPPPPDVVVLFEDVDRGDRTDWYAWTGRDDIGLKVRNGRRVGLKRRRCRLELGDGLPSAERWSRQSARVRRGLSLESSDGWTPVHKQRRRLVMELGPPAPTAVDDRPGRPPRRRPARGGSIELVRLDTPGHRRWWSVALETWGPSDREDLIALAAVGGIDWLGVHERGAFAGAYPAWLRALGR